MYKIFSLLFIPIILLLSSSAEALTISSKPVSQISDPSHVFSFDSYQRLNSQLSKINNDNIDIGILILPLIESGKIEKISSQTMKSWKLGKNGLENGVLVILAIKEHQFSIETGKDIEHQLTDELCYSVLYSARPFLRIGNFENVLQ